RVVERLMPIVAEPSSQRERCRYLAGYIGAFTRFAGPHRACGRTARVVTVGQPPLVVIPVIADLVVQLAVRRVPHFAQPVQTDAGFIQNVRNIVMVDVGENLGMKFISVQHQRRLESIRYYDLDDVTVFLLAANHSDVTPSLIMTATIPYT